MLSSGTVLGPITLLKIGVGCPCTAGNWLIEASSGSAFLASSGMMDRLGMKIYCVPVRVGELEVLMKFGLYRVILAINTAVFTPRGVEPSLSVLLTSLGVQKMCAPLRTASATISFGSIIWYAPKVSRIPFTSSMMIWSIGQIVHWMISGKNRFFNHFCGKLPLVV